jgi:SnoaL-like protein
MRSDAAPPLPPVAAVVSFIDAINRRDVARLGELMSEDHALKVFEEDPLVGRVANMDAWRGYVEAFPAYVISPHRIAERDGRVAVVGHTTGSHLALDDEAESKLTLIWIADVVDGLLRSWALADDTVANRAALGLDGA